VNSSPLCAQPGGRRSDLMVCTWFSNTFLLCLAMLKPCRCLQFSTYWCNASYTISNFCCMILLADSSVHLYQKVIVAS
jgi:hypothetical protein